MAKQSTICLLLLIIIIPLLAAAPTNSSSATGPKVQPKPSPPSPGLSKSKKKVITFGASHLTCPTGCRCSINVEGKLSAMCTHGMKKFPTGLPANLSVLNILCNTLKDGNGRPIVDFEYMTSIPRNAFNATPFLEEFDISGCPIAELPPLAFANLPRLTSLSLQALLLRRLDGTAFHGSYKLTSLQIINMADLVQVDSVLLSGQTQLATVVLRRTALTGVVVKQMLSPLRRCLKRLTWSLNTVEASLPITTFSGFRLRELDLSRNQLTDMTFLINTRTRTLKLNGNPRLAMTPPFDFSRCPSLRSLIELNLRATNLRELPANSLSHLKRLRRLYLGNNFLQSVPTDIYTHLATAVTRLDLSKNRIQWVPQGMEAMFKRHGFEVLLEGNPIHCNCEAAWLLRYPTFLRQVKCASTPESRANLVQRTLTADRKEDLVCTPPSGPVIQVTNAVQMRTMQWGARISSALVSERSVGGDGGPAGGRLIQYKDGRKIVRVSRGQTLSLRCSSKGDPAPDLYWIFPWGARLKRIAPQDRTIFSNEVEAKILQSHLGYLREANFTCRAVNRVAVKDDYITLENMHPVATTKKLMKKIPSKPSQVTPQPSIGGGANSIGTAQLTRVNLLCLISPLATALWIAHHS